MKSADTGRISRLLQQWAGGDAQARDDLDTPRIPGTSPARRGVSAARTPESHAAADGAGERGLHAPDGTAARVVAQPGAVLRRRRADHAADSGGPCARASGSEARRRPQGDAGRRHRHPAPRQLRGADADDALQELARIDERQARIVELKYFGGLSEEEVAAILTLSRATITREWQSARAWMYPRMTTGRVVDREHDGRSQSMAAGQGDLPLGPGLHRRICAPAFVRDACGEDVALRDDVESLLAAHADAGSFAEGAAIDGLMPRDFAMADSRVPALAAGGELGPITSWVRSMPVAWVRCIGRSTPSCTARLPSRCCRRRCRSIPTALRGWRGRLRLLAALNHPHIATIHGLEMAGRPARHRHGADRRADTGRSPRQRTPAARPVARDRGSDRGGAGGCARQRRHPPGSQAGQRQVHRVGRREGARLWPRQGDGVGHARGPQCFQHWRRGEPRVSGGGNARVHEPGTGTRRARGRTE